MEFTTAVPFLLSLIVGELFFCCGMLLAIKERIGRK